MIAVVENNYNLIKRSEFIKEEKSYTIMRIICYHIIDNLFKIANNDALFDNLKNLGANIRILFTIVNYHYTNKKSHFKNWQQH